MPKKRKRRRIRPLALCVFRHEDKLFLSRGYDSHKGETFYRPIGGRIEFGERGADTVTREVMEEIGAEVRDLVYLGALESVFTYEGASHHEIVLIYDGKFRDRAMYDEGFTVTGRDDGEVLYQADWRHLGCFRGEDAPPLYPAGLLALLDANAP